MDTLALKVDYDERKSGLREQFAALTGNEPVSKEGYRLTQFVKRYLFIQLE